MLLQSLRGGKNSLLHVKRISELKTGELWMATLCLKKYTIHLG